MKTLLVSALALVLFAPAAHAAEPFGPSAYALEAAFVAALAFDRGQTSAIHSFCNGRIGCTVHETNPLLGRDPSQRKINRYFALGALAHAAVSYSLSGHTRTAWQASSLVLEVAVIGRNKRLGLSVRF